MNVMEDNKYVVRLTKDVIYYWQLLPWRVSIGNWEGRPLLLFSRGGGWGAAARTWYTWARLLATVRQMNSRSQTPDPRQWRKSNLDSTKKVESRNNQFFYRCTSMASYMHQPASKLFPSSSCKWSKPQDNARASDPIQPFTLDLPSQFWVPCDFSSPIWGVCSQGLCALAACHESAINFVLLFQTPKNTNYENIFFSVHREKKGKLSTGIQEFSKYDLAPLLLDLIF